jgi:hypothetical protein
MPARNMLDSEQHYGYWITIVILVVNMVLERFRR